MSLFILIPGAGGLPSDWQLLVPELQARGHEAVAVDLRGGGPKAGIEAYSKRVIAATGSRTDAILVAHSLGGFTAPLVATRAKIAKVVLVNAMIPLPGETAGKWWGNTGSDAARRKAAERDGRSPEFDLAAYFLHDVPPAIARQYLEASAPEGSAAFDEPCQFDAWPAIPVRIVIGNDDRFFPSEFQHRIARERTTFDTAFIPGGHMLALANPKGLAKVLVDFANEPKR